MALKLYTTPLSHFARKARLLLDLYQIPYEAVDAGSVVASGSPREIQQDARVIAAYVGQAEV